MCYTNIEYVIYICTVARREVEKHLLQLLINVYTKLLNIY